jgi:teichuronic acid exporter
MESLKARTVRGIFWSFLDSFGVYLVKFGFSIVIARTLSPEDYGLMGMIVIFISLGQMIMQSGFSMALIQKKDSDTRDLSTAFWFNVAVALLVYTVLFFSAGAIASFYGKPILISITRVAALGIILNALCSVQVSILTKRMDFKKLTWINLAGALISGTTGLIMALKGYAVWALVFQTLAGNLIYLIGLWISSGWKPSTVFNVKSFRSLFSFGYKIMLQGLTDVIFTKAYFPLIGKFYTTSQLGYYTNASRFNDLFIRQTSNSVTRVIFPAFATIQDEKERFNSNYTKSYNLLAALMFLGSVILIISSRPFIAIALTDKWLPAVPLMQLLFIEGFFFPLLMFNQNIICSLGKSGLSLKIDIIRKAAILISIILVFRLGIEALITGMVAASGLAFIISTVAVIRLQGVRLQHIALPLLKLYFVVAVCLLVSYFIIEPLVKSDWSELILKCTLIPVIFLGLSWLIGLGVLKDIKAFFTDHKIIRPES